MNLDMVSEIYESFINGQKKQMVEQISEYEIQTGESFWKGLDAFMSDWKVADKYNTLLDMVSYYTKYK